MTSEADQRSKLMRRAGAVALVTRFANVAVGLIATPFLVEGLQPAVFGLFATITSISAFASISDLGVGGSLLTLLPRSLASSGDERAARRLSTSAYTVSLGSTVAIAVISIAIAQVDDLAILLGAPPGTTDEVATAFLVYMVLFGCTIPLGLAGKIQMGLQQGSAAALWQAGGAVFASVFAALVAVTTGQLVLTMTASILPLVLVPVAQTCIVLVRTPNVRPSLRLLEWSGLKSLSKTSGALLVLQICAVVAMQTDLIVVSYMLGSEAAGVLSVTTRVFGLTSIVGTSMLFQFWPAMSDGLARGEIAWVRREWLRLSMGLGVFGVVVGGILVLAGRWLIDFWVGAALIPPVSLLVVMAAWNAYYIAILPTAQLLNAAHAFKMQTWLVVIMVPVNLGLSLSLTASIGVAGSTLASLISHAFIVGIASAVQASRILRPNNYASIST